MTFVSLLRTIPSLLTTISGCGVLCLTGVGHALGFRLDLRLPPPAAAPAPPSIGEGAPPKSSSVTSVAISTGDSWPGLTEKSAASLASADESPPPLIMTKFSESEEPSDLMEMLSSLLSAGRMADADAEWCAELMLMLGDWPGAAPRKDASREDIMLLRLEVRLCFLAWKEKRSKVGTLD